MSYKIMRVVVLFDLPTDTAGARRSATRFRNSLLKDGFDMLQYSVYTRICANRDIADKHMLRVKQAAPTNGSVRMLYITEHQFSHMFVIAGEKTTNERHIPAKQLVFF